jgi:hypothetical protein
VEQLDDLRDRERVEEARHLGAADRGVLGGDGLREGDREGLLLVLLPGCRLSEGGAVRTAGVLGDGSRTSSLRCGDSVEEGTTSACLRLAHASSSSGRWPRMRSAVVSPRSESGIRGMFASSGWQLHGRASPKGPAAVRRALGFGGATR